MKIIGWIRKGDRAACGGVVAEGSPADISFGRELSFEGASMLCAKDCFIAESDRSTIMPNGRGLPFHGHSTSCGCPLISTLNDRDGRGNSSGLEIFPAFALSEHGWIGIHPPSDVHDQNFDNYFVLMDEKTGDPARNRFYRITLDSGEIIEGYTDDQGRTAYAVSNEQSALSIEVAPQHEIQVGD